MRSEDRFATVTVIAVLAATGALFVVMNAEVPRVPEYEVALEPVATVEPLRRASSGDEREPDASLAVLREGTTIPIPAVEAPVELPALIAAAVGVLAARAPAPGLPSADAVLVREDADGRLVVAAGTVRRYRPLVEELEAFRPAELARAVEDGRGIQVLAAIDRLLAVEVPEVEPEMARRGIRWGFADPSSEALDEAQRHLLLMGDRQHRRVRSALLELRAALGAYPEPAGTGFATATLGETGAHRDGTAEGAGAPLATGEPVPVDP